LVRQIFASPECWERVSYPELPETVAAGVPAAETAS
jgi:hypothetical protein